MDNTNYLCTGELSDALRTPKVADRQAHKYKVKQKGLLGCEERPTYAGKVLDQILQISDGARRTSSPRNR